MKGTKHFFSLTSFSLRLGDDELLATETVARITLCCIEQPMVNRNDKKECNSFGGNDVLHVSLNRRCAYLL